MASVNAERPRLAAISQRLDGLTMSADRKRVPELLLMALAIGFNGFNAWRFSLPMGYAGLFSLMAEEIAASGFRLPSKIPFYGPGGIPFAYPPLGPYLAALFTELARMPLMTYLRFAPPLFGVLSVAAAAFMATRVLGNRHKGLLAAALFGTTAIEYIYQGTAAGIVRGPAMVFLLIGLGFGWEAVRAHRRTNSNVVLTGLMLALTILTHLSYAVVFAVALTLFNFYPGPASLRTRSVRTLRVVALSALIISPWLVITVSSAGTAVFRAALATHGNLGLIPGLLHDTRHFLQTLWWTTTGIGVDWWTSIPFVGLFLAGLVFAWMQGRWLLPAWFLILLLFTGEPSRFLVLAASLLIADFAIDAAVLTRAQNGGGHPSLLWRQVAPVGVILGFCMLAGFRDIRAQKPLLSPEILSLGTWMRTVAPTDSRTYLIAKDHDLAEWIPYLTHTTPVVAPWGAEWVGRYDEQLGLMAQLETCTFKYDCLTGALARSKAMTDYLIVSADLGDVVARLSLDANWQDEYQDSGFIVFHRQS